ncbi:MAG: radical SAM protein [Clostridia bacterium]|nr:radical SAM protein [Clostridia bacterium]
MKISRKDALTWFRFFAELPEDEPLGCRQQEIALAVFSQIETAVENRRKKVLEAIPGLKAVVPGTENLRPWTSGLPACTLFVGPEEKFPAGCRSCLLGTGLSAVRKTNRCNLACPFCYDYGMLDEIEPIGEGLWEIGGGRYREEDLPLLFALQGKPTGIAYVYLEPFMEIEKYYGIIRRFREAGVHQHMYTNGINANEENLKALGEAGLDELRFNLGASGAADRVIDAMAIAKKYIPRVGIETPMTREFFRALEAKKEKILATGIDFMNCAELHLNDNNLVNYAGEPMYFCRMGYLSPIISRDLTLQVMKTAAEEHWPIAVHDCSNKTKIARDLNLAAREGGWFGRSVYGREIESIPYEAFLPALEDETLPFAEEEELPRGYRPGEIVL